MTAATQPDLFAPVMPATAPAPTESRKPAPALLDGLWPVTDIIPDVRGYVRFTLAGDPPRHLPCGPRVTGRAVKVLVACEFSGVVRSAFRARGHDAWSCDILPAEDGSWHHLQTDVRAALRSDWDLMIAHPPCTHLAVSGARWFKDKLPEQAAALEFVRLLLEAPIPRIALDTGIAEAMADYWGA